MTGGDRLVYCHECGDGFTGVPAKLTKSHTWRREVPWMSGTPQARWACAQETGCCAPLRCAPRRPPSWGLLGLGCWSSFAKACDSVRLLLQLSFWENHFKFQGRDSGQGRGNEADQADPSCWDAGAWGTGKRWVTSVLPLLTHAL